MSNEEEKRCPLCAEEMDWTDQQLKPCKCGYEVCVWCWHHIMDMAEKDVTEGRCPACRTPYDKDRIVGLEANFQRVAANNSSRKQKQPKAKQKPNEVKKDLSNVRVIQRKMAYIIGLPLSLADEDLLQRKDYFGQYGKVTKVSLSRTAGGTVQQFVNDTCSVYITYSKEEEAVRCIQSVHGYMLDGRFLRASFGTAKYCHAWLRNMPCNNPSCLYLHNIGAEEDSFGKDEIAAVHTRNRVQEIVGATQYLHKRSGSMLPPPVDEHLNNQSLSPEEPVFSSGLKDVAYATVASGDHIPCSKDGIIKSSKHMTTFVDIVGRSSNSNSDKEASSFEEPPILNLCSDMSSISIDRTNSHTKTENPSLTSSKSSSPFGTKLYSDPFRETSKQSGLVLQEDSPNDYSDRHGWGQNGHSVNNHADEATNVTQEHSGLNPSYPAKVIKDYYSDRHGWGQNGHSVNNHADEATNVPQEQSGLNPSYPAKAIKDYYSDHQGWVLNGHSVNNHADEATNVTQEQSGLNPSYPAKVIKDYYSDHHGWGQNGHYVNSYADEATISFRESFKPDINVTQEQSVLNIKDYSDYHGWGQNGHSVNIYADEGSLQSKSDRIYRCSKSFSNEEIVEHLRRLDVDDDNIRVNDDDENAAAVESSIISNILSMDFDGCDDSVLPQTVAGLFEGKEGRNGNLWNFQNSDQSRFSFANEQQGYNGQELGRFSVFQDSGENQDYTHRPQYQASRVQNLTPPGFSKPPPGFPSCMRTEQVVSASSGNHYRTPSLGNLSNSSDDLIDPAIMVVGRGKTPTNVLNNNSSFHIRSNSFDEDTKLWLLMQQQQFSQTAFTHHQFPSYGSGLHHQSYNPPQFANGHMYQQQQGQQVEQIQRNERLGLEKLLPGYTRVFGM